jgi:hypothetical protein
MKYSDSENNGCWTNEYYNDPLGSAALDKDGYRKDLGEGHYYYYFPEKTAFVNIINNTIKKLDANFSVVEDGEKVRHFKISDLNDYLGSDAYSLRVNNKYEAGSDNPWNKVIYEGFTHYYQDYKGSQKITISDSFYLLRDSNYNYFIPYALKFGLKNYSKDFYGEHREIYSEFTELVDLFSSGISDDAKGFLKQYYYNKLVSLYRESNIQDVYPLGVKSDGKKPMQLMPKLSEKFNGLAGQYRSAGTLLSSYYNNGGANDTGIKLKFFKFDVSVDESLKATMKFYVKREDFINAFGYDFNKYFVKKDLSKVSNSVLRAQLKEAIDLMYKKQFSNVRPSFLFYDEHPSYYPIKEDVYVAVKRDGKLVYEKKIITNKDGTTSVAKKEVPSVWQTIRSKLSCDYSEAEALLTDENFKAITDDSGNILDANGQEINVANTVSLKRRLDESKYIIITVENKTSLLKTPEARNVFQIDGHQNEEKNNIYGYLSVKQLKQSFIDNYISFPKSLDWIEKDENNIASEYISFGDDRAISITLNNNLFIKYEYTPSNDLLVFFDKEYYRLVDGDYVRVSNKELEGISNPMEAGLYNKTTSLNYDYYNKYIKATKHNDIHDEEVVKVSNEGYPYVYENDEEKVLVNYDRHQLLEDQGYKPVYVNTISEEIKASSDSIKQVIEVDNQKVKNYTCDNIYYDPEGNIVLQLSGDYLHTSNIRNILIAYQINYLAMKVKKVASKARIKKPKLFFLLKGITENIIASIFTNDTLNISQNINGKKVRARAKIKKALFKIKYNIAVMARLLSSMASVRAARLTDLSGVDTIDIRTRLKSLTSNIKARDFIKTIARRIRATANVRIANIVSAIFIRSKNLLARARIKTANVVSTVVACLKKITSNAAIRKAIGFVGLPAITNTVVNSYSYESRIRNKSGQVVTVNQVIADICYLMESAISGYIVNISSTITEDLWFGVFGRTKALSTTVSMQSSSASRSMERPTAKTINGTINVESTIDIELH